MCGVERDKTSSLARGEDGFLGSLVPGGRTSAWCFSFMPTKQSVRQASGKGPNARGRLLLLRRPS